MEGVDNSGRKNSKKERRRSSKTEPDQARDEIKKFKENLLQSVASGGDSILSQSGAEITIPSRSRSASRARDSLAIPDKVLAELDETKVFELKEAFLLFDLNGDGCIDHNDLRATLVSLGENVDENAVKNMLAEAPSPLDFDGFVKLLGYQTLELDSEETLIQALSRWDKDSSGYISEERFHVQSNTRSWSLCTRRLFYSDDAQIARVDVAQSQPLHMFIKIRHDLMTWGDKFTEKEADYALDDAPTVQKGGATLIDYITFCNQLGGLRKANKK